MERRGALAARKALAAATVALLVTASATAAPERRVYHLAIVPQAPPVSVSMRWSEVATAIGREAGIDLELQLFENFSQFEEAIAAGAPHFAYVNPLQAVDARRSGYEPLVRSSVPIAGAVFVRNESAITRVEELRGRPVALVGARNICTVLLRAALRDILDEPRFVGTTGNVFKHVLVGEEVAGGTLVEAADELAPDVSAQLRPVYRTASVAPHPIVAHRSVPAEVREAIVRAVLRLGDDERGRALLARVRLQDPVRADYRRDYAELEALAPVVTSGR